jgi:D-amino-acid oxidase
MAGKKLRKSPGVPEDTAAEPDSRWGHCKRKGSGRIRSLEVCVNRRTLLKAAGTMMLGTAAGGCASFGRPSASGARHGRTRINLAPIEASWERVIRTTVGLRPHRPAGFVLKAEKLDGKLLVHDYGHGGAGHSLGWGTGAMAADLALQQSERRAAVIGCGTVGLTAARQLQRRGFDVTIYAMAVPPYTTSNMSLAAFTPTSGLISGPRSPEWDAQFRQAVEISYSQLQLLAGRGYGVSWIDSYTMTDTPDGGGGRGESDGGERNDRSAARGLLPPGMQTERVVLGPGEHPFPAKYALRRPTIRIEPAIYLDALVAEVTRFGAHIVVRKFDTVRDLFTLDEPVIVNCTGLGSRDLFGDATMMPVKGQLTVLVPQLEVNYWASGGGARSHGARASAMPRSDGIALGSTMERGVWTLDPNEDARKRNVDGAIAVFGAMRGLDPTRPITHFVVADRPPSVEAFLDEAF